MIIIGYPGIGKSTLTEKYFGRKYIDLESSIFSQADDASRRDSSWACYYANVASSLSRQGYVVFVSSHDRVAYELSKIKDAIIMCYPSQSLKKEWIERLRERYVATPDDHPENDKNYRAYRRAMENYDSDINIMCHTGFPSVVIESMDYDLQALLGLNDE